MFNAYDSGRWFCSLKASKDSFVVNSFIAKNPSFDCNSKATVTARFDTTDNNETKANND